MDTRVAALDSRYLKTPDGTVYGPVDDITMCAWAAEARVTPGCLVSRDREAWQDAVEIPELRLHWQTALPDGTVVGPLNLFALWELMQDGSLPKGLSMRNRLTGAEVPLDERLVPVALGESRAILDAMAAQMTAGMARLASSPEREALRERLTRAEKELADNLRLMGESQRLLVAREQQMKALESRLAESQASTSAVRRELELSLTETARAGDSARDNGAAAVQAGQAELLKARAETDRLRTGLERAETAWAAERDALNQRAMAAAAQAKQQGQATDAAEAKLKALTARIEAVQQAAETQVAGMTARVDAMRQAADAVKADLERGLVEARRAAETAEARSAAARQSLEARMADAVQECAALTSTRDELRTALAAAVAEKDTARQRLQEVEHRLEEAARERDDARRRLGDLEQTVEEMTEREAAARRDMAAAEADWTARNEAHEQAVALLRHSAGEAEAAWKAEREALLLRFSSLESRLAEVDRTVAERDAQLAEAAKQRESLLAEASRNENSCLERAEQRKREVEQTARTLGESRAELAAARQALATERERSAVQEKRLKGEIKDLQRDLHALDMVKTASRKLRDERPASGPMIDWLSGGSAAPAATGGGAGPTDKFAGLDLRQQVDLLHQELTVSMDDKERLRRDLAKIRADYLELERRSEAGGLEAGTKASQLQNEVQSSASMLQQTMAELERRESAARQHRKKTEEREKELQDRISALEAELARKEQEAPVVIEGEWETPRAASTPPPPDGAPSGNGVTGKPAAAVLSSVEAQLRAELEHWHSLEQGKDRSKDKPQHWFRWKKHD